MVQIVSTNGWTEVARNPTNGSWWIVQIVSTNKLAEVPRNPTNGNWWMVQIVSTNPQMHPERNPHELRMLRVFAATRRCFVERI
jgi:hypothetical protein